MEEENRKTFVHFDFFEDLTADIPTEPCRGMEDIGERICQLREEKGLSLEELSRLTGFEVSFLSSLVKDEAHPQLGTVVKLSKALDNAFGRLVSGVGEKICLNTRINERRTVFRSTSKKGQKPVYTYISLPPTSRGLWSNCSRAFCRVSLFFLLLPALAITGCMGAIALHDAVMSYDESLSDLEMKMLLMNIARTHSGLPHHFTLTSNIAATFAYQANAGFTGTFSEGMSRSNTYGVSLGGSVVENPTFNIVPMQGEEFTTRVLTPIDESKFLFLVFQGAPLAMVMRMMAQGIELQNRKGEVQGFILNWPGHKDYYEFRDVALRLAQLLDNRELFVQRIYFEDSVRGKLAGPPSTADLANALEKGYRWHEIGSGNIYELTKPSIGRVAITNYDPRILTNAERQALNARATMNPNNFVLLDIRADHPGG
jgi:transcriptional regulator with XRE-family HTH domain